MADAVEKTFGGTPRKPLHYGVVVVATGFLGVTASIGLARFGYTMVLPLMRQALDISDAQAGLLASANLLGYLLFTLLAGALAARFGPRLMASLGLAWVGVAMALTGLASSLEFALGARFLTGLGSAGANIAIMGMPSAWAAPSRRGLTAGVLVGGSGLGLVLAGFLVPVVVQAYGDDGWRIAWYGMGGLGIITALLAWTLLRNSPAEKRVLPLGAGTGAMQAAHVEPGRAARGVDAATVQALGDPAEHQLAIGGASTTAPSWGQVYHSRQLWRLAALYAVWGFVYIIYATFFARYLIAEVGYRPVDAGGLWSLVGTFSLFCGLLWGWVADRAGRRAALGSVFGLQAVAMWCFAATPGLPVLAPISAVLFGVTAWSTPGIMATLAGDYCGARMAPAGLGFITFFFAIGQTLGPYLAGAVADVVGTFAPGFVLSGVLLLGCAVASLWLPGRAAAAGAEGAS